MSLGEGVFPTGRRHALYLRGRSLKEEVCHYWKGYVLVEGVSLKEVFPYERGCVLQRGMVCSCGRGHFFWGGICPLEAGVTLMQEAYLYRNENLWKGHALVKG